MKTLKNPVVHVANRTSVQVDKPSCASGIFIMEIWKDIKGFEGKYQVSNHGNVRSLDRMVKNRYGFRISRGTILKPSIGNSGYYHITLSGDKNHPGRDIHRLVALVFIGYENEHLTVNHKDGKKLNNQLSNLEFMTQGDNNRHKVFVLGKKGGRCVKGELNPMFGRKHSDETKLKISLSKIK